MTIALIPFLMNGCATTGKTTLKGISKKNISDEDLPILKAPQANCVRKREYIDGDKYFGSQIVCTIEKHAVWTGK